MGRREEGGREWRRDGAEGEKGRSERKEGTVGDSSS